MNDILDQIFKSYDIRGIAETQITSEIAYFVGNALAQRNNLQTCIVGRDARKTSPELAAAVIKGLVDAGVEVQDIGLCSTPLIKWAVGKTDVDAGIMVSASHNPPEYNGFKILQKYGLALGGFNGLDELKNYQEPVTQDGGSVTQHSYVDAFVQEAMQVLKTSDVPIFIDPSGGVGSPELKRLGELGDYNFTFYNADIDPAFSVHSPNPLDADATEAAKDYCAMHRCVGVVLDADADRVIFIDEEGSVVPADFFGAWLADKQGLAKAAATVRDSRAIKEAVSQQQGEFEMTPVGHAFVQNMLYEKDLDIGIEKSGHLFFKESYCAENHVLAILYTLKHLGQGASLADDIKAYKEHYLCSEEHNYRVRDKQEVLTAAQTHFAKEADIIRIDGVLAEGKDWWVSVRASNTEPLMRLTWEARNPEDYAALKERVFEFIRPFKQE